MTGAAVDGDGARLIDRLEPQLPAALLLVFDRLEGAVTVSG